MRYQEDSIARAECNTGPAFDRRLCEINGGDPFGTLFRNIGMDESSTCSERPPSKRVSFTIAISGRTTPRQAW